MKKISNIILVALTAILFTPTMVGAVLNYNPYSIQQGGTATSTFPSGQLIYGAGTRALQSVATTTASCSGSASCTAFTIIGSSPITISATGGTGGTGTVSTSSVPTIGNLAYWTSNGFPSLLGSVATGTVSGGTGISVTAGQSIVGSGLTITNSAPDQTVALTNGTGISVSGTYPNFTITNTAPSSGGGTDGNWSWWNGSGIRLATSTNQVLAGGTATTTLKQFEVGGTGTAFIPYASTTMISSETASTTNQYVSTLGASTMFGNIASRIIYATTSGKLLDSSALLFITSGTHSSGIYSPHFVAENNSQTDPSYGFVGCSQCGFHEFGSGYIGVSNGNGVRSFAFMDNGASTTLMSLLGTLYVGTTATTTIRGDGLASTLPYASTTALSATSLCLSSDCRTSWFALGDTYHTALTASTQVLATSSDINIGLNIVSSGSTHNFTPVWLGTLADDRITSASTWNAKLSNINGLAAGNTTEIQVNDSDNFAAYAGLTFTSSTGILNSSNLTTGQATTTALYDTSLAASAGDCVQIGALGLFTSSGNPCGGGAAGNTTELQVNNAGALAGFPGLTFTSATGILSTQNLTVSGQSTTSQQYITSLANPAGAFLAVDPNGLVISTTTPAGGSGTPGGNPTEIQYNNGGAFGGMANVTTDGTNLGIGSSTPFYPLSLGANNPSYTYFGASLPDMTEVLNFSITGGNPTLQVGVVGAGTAQLNVDGNITGNWNGNTIASTLGGTGLTSNTAGSLLVGSPAGGNAWTAYATTSLGGFLSQNYTTGMPTWTATSTLGLSFANIGGTLGVAKGGTGATTFTAGALLYGAGTGVVQTVATTTLTATSPLALSNAISVIGSTPSALSLGTVTYDLGGTGQTTWAQGDMLYASAANTLGKLTVGSNGQCLTSNGTIPVWGACGAGTQTPWAQAIDGGGFALTNAGAITGTSLTATSTSLVSYIRNALSLGTTTVNTAMFDIFGNSTTTGRSLQITDSASTTLLSVDNTGSTTITQLVGGALSADYDAGVMSLFDMPIASTTSAVGTQFSASLGINGTSTLTVYAEKSSATAATTYRDRIGIGTTTPQRLLHLSAGGAGTGTTTIKMDKIQFEGGNSAGTLTCVYIVGTSFVVQAGACPASSE